MVDICLRKSTDLAEGQRLVSAAPAGIEKAFGRSKGIWKCGPAFARDGHCIELTTSEWQKVSKPCEELRSVNAEKEAAKAK